MCCTAMQIIGSRLMIIFDNVSALTAVNIKNRYETPQISEAFTEFTNFEQCCALNLAELTKNSNNAYNNTVKNNKKQLLTVAVLGWQ